MQITFHGGARNVTGANYLFEHNHTKILIDCGLEQGTHYAESRNFSPFPYDPREITAVLVTHAHIDHTGLIPRLVKEGFRGNVFSTPPTKDFAELLLLDSEHLLGEEAAREGHAPLYTIPDIQAAMGAWRKVSYHTPFDIEGVRAEFLDAGHILGSAIIRITAGKKTILFSGDLGNSPAPIVKPTEPVAYADYCVIESTYGNRVHEATEARREMLEDVIEDTVKAGGVLLIPAFAMERTQELLYYLNQLREMGRIPRVPIFIDSPLAIKVTAIYKKYENYFNAEAHAAVHSGDDILNFPGLHLALTREQSKEINDVPPPKVIIAGSGMSQGGRISHHEKRYLPDPKSTILFAGYQAQGSLGREILEGAPHVVIHGETVSVRAKKKTLSGFSAHADQPRLLAWLRPMRESLAKVFVVQGEEDASEALAQKVKDELAVAALVPRKGETVVL